MTKKSVVLYLVIPIQGVIQMLMLLKNGLPSLEKINALR